jgi:mono/diheme cytochrome c family protein
VKTRIVLMVAAIAAMPSLALADAAAGKAKFESVCADCHEPADFAGRTAADLTTTLKAIAAGTVKHKGKVKLSDAEIADVVAHLKGGASGAASAGRAAAPSTPVRPGATSGTSGTAAKQAASTGRATTAAEAAVADPAGTKASMPPMQERPGSVSPAAANPAARPATSAPASATAGKAPPASTPATGAVGGAATSAVATTTGVAGNPAVTGAGKATFEQNCSKCHEVADFAGQPAADLQERLGAIVGGKVKHKPPLKLSDAERQSVAAYLSAGR